MSTPHNTLGLTIEPGVAGFGSATCWLVWPAERPAGPIAEFYTEADAAEYVRLRQAAVVAATAVVATHKCKKCGALWRLVPPSPGFPQMTWSLVSTFCGPCCDNVAMGGQIEELRSSAATGRREALEKLRGELAEARDLLLAQPQESEETTRARHCRAWANGLNEAVIKVDRLLAASDGEGGRG